MRFLSLFTGIGGMDIGLEMAGFQCVAQCEREPFCRESLAERFRGVPCFDDVTTLDAAMLAPVGLIEAVAGGFPCQDISSAGKGVGIDGERSGLWREMLRVIDVVRPRWVIAENVPAIRTRGADRVLGDLERIGYAGWPVVVAAEDVGAPHRRQRAFFVAHSDRERGRQAIGGATAGGRDLDGPCPTAVDDRQGERSGRRGPDDGATRGDDHASEAAGGTQLADGDGVGRSEQGGLAKQPDEYHQSSRAALADPAHDHGGRGVVGTQEGTGPDGRGRGRPASRVGAFPPGPGDHAGWRGVLAADLDLAPATPVERQLRGVAHGLPARVGPRWRREALKALGNAVVPQVAEVVGRGVLMADAKLRAMQTTQGAA